MFNKLEQFSFNHSEQIDRLYEVMTGQNIKQAFDSRGEELRLSFNNLIDGLISIVDSSSGADNIGMTPITELGADYKTVQGIIEKLINILKSTLDNSSGADFISATNIIGLTGNTVQALLESLKTYIDTYKNELDSTVGASKIKTSNGNTVQQELTTAINDSSEAKSLASTANNRVNNIVSNTPINKDAELVDIRFDALNNKTYETAGKRIDNITLSLAEKSQQIKKISVILTDYQNLVVNNDWSNALLQAILDVQEGGTVKIPVGTFIASTNADFESDWATRLSSKSFKIVGDGANSILKVKDGTDFALRINYPISQQVLNGTGNHKFNAKSIIIEDLAVDCNGRPYGIKFISGAGVRTKNLYIYNNSCKDGETEEQTGGLYIEGAGMYRFENIYATPNSTGTAIYIGYGAGDGSISGCDIAAGAIGILMKDCTGDTRVFDNTIYNQNKHCIKTNGNLHDNNQLNIHNNQLAEAGISILSINDGTIKAANALNIHDNLIWINNCDGIILGNVARFICSKNIIAFIANGITSGKYGILSKGNLQGSIVDNIIEKIEIGGIGIGLSSGDDIEVTGNKLYECANDVTTKFISLTGTTNRVTIGNNPVRQSGSNFYWLYYSGTHAEFRLLGKNQNNHGQMTTMSDVWREELAPGKSFTNSGFLLPSSAWNVNPLRLGSYHIWVSASGVLRIKGSAPTSDSDGVAVGSQS